MTITTNRTVDARHDGAVTNDADPDPEVPERARGPRRFPVTYKARILAEYETLSKAEKGALLRREGLYSLLLTEWRRQRDQGAEEALGRSPGRQAADPRDKEMPG
jgi:transposase-like protein